MHNSILALFIAISCCRPMVYNKYMNVSDSNCVSSPPVCPSQPVDGCVCGEGYVLDNNKCVLPQDCGCWYNNSIYIQVYVYIIYIYIYVYILKLFGGCCN